jgi:hypothetical protein
MSSNSDTLRVFFAVPEDQAYGLKLTPCRFTENSGPTLPVHGRAIKIAPGERKVSGVPMMGYVHAHLMPIDGRADTRPVPFHGRCAVMVEVERDGCLSIASLVTLFPPLERGGPRDPDVTSATLVGPGERRLIYLREDHGVWLHEIPRFFD